jgi:hypothetical protein
MRSSAIHWIIGMAAAVVAVHPVRADVTPRTVEVVMTAVVTEVSGVGIVRQTRQGGDGSVRSFTVRDLPGFPLAPGASFSLAWRASAAGFEPFFDEDGLPVCQPFQLAGVSAGPARSTCTNEEAAATVLFSSLSFADRLGDDPVAAGPNIYLGDYSVDLVYVPSTFWSHACCAYAYDWNEARFTLRDEPGLFDLTGRPHTASGAFIGHRGWLDYAFDIDGDGVTGSGLASLRFAVDWRFRNYGTTGLPAPGGVLLLGLGLIALLRRHRSA